MRRGEEEAEKIIGRAREDERRSLRRREEEPDKMRGGA